MLFIEHFDFGTPAYDESVRLRDDILRKPLGLEFAVTDLASEYNSIHFGAYDQRHELLGCLVLVPLPEGVYKMRQVAVAESTQSKGVGTALVKACEEFVKSKKGNEIVLHARDLAIPFYLKLSYKKVGKKFTEVGIDHFKMQKSI